MRALLAVGLVLGLVGFAGAQDKKDEKKDDKKADPTGTWKWETERNGQKRATTLKLKLDGDKLTGTMPGRQGAETKIEDGTFKDGEVSFSITRDMNGTKVVTKYKGKMDGDTLKLTIERDGGNKTEVEAKKEKADK